MQAIATHLTFHYLDGRNESFTVYTPTDGPESSSPSPLQSFHAQLRQLLEKPRWVLHLADKTVVINMDTVVKVEIQPPLAPPEADELLAHTTPIMTFHLTS
ncbi:MAG: hypothetical protein F6K09_09610, partial [Merismopedia sp. SIO2A8]|nr:hypothetical protein [Merismopedia sp. SIO2A8]